MQAAEELSAVDLFTNLNEQHQMSGTSFNTDETEAKTDIFSNNTHYKIMCDGLIQKNPLFKNDARHSTIFIQTWHIVFGKPLQYLVWNYVHPI